MTAKGNAVHMRLRCTVGWSPPVKVFDAGVVSCDARRPSGDLVVEACRNVDRVELLPLRPLCIGAGSSLNSCL